MILFLITFLPSILIVLYIIKSDKFREPISLIISTFFLGFLLCLPAGILNDLLIFSNENSSDYVFLAGVTEESLKFIALYFYIKDRIEFNEPMDAIVYGCLISLGFATYENYGYVFLYDYGAPSLNIAIIRSISAIPLHACCGIIMGYLFIFYHFNKNIRFLFLSLAIPILIHASYNFLTNKNEFILNIFVVILIVVTIFLHKLVQAQQNENQ